MTISVPLAEPKTVDYIFIDENNRVHILLPVVGGDTIGLDNTCKTVIELQTFFYGQKELKDKEGAITQHRRPSALEVFAEYIKKIEQDINLLSKLGIYEKLLEEKKQRLEQMKQYVSLLSKVQDLYVNPTTEYPISPDEIHYLFKQQTNALTIHLSPETPDRFLNTSGPIFSLKRQEAHFYLQYNQQQFGVRPEGDVYDGFGPKLRAALRVKLQEPSSVSSPKDTIIAEVTAHYEGQPKPSLKDLQDFTTTLIRQKNPEGLKNLDLTHYSDNQLIDESFFSDILGLSYDEILVSDAVDNLLGAALRNDEAFWSRLQPAKLIQPQAGVSNEKNAEDIAMAVQFFLASIAVHCKKEKIDASGLGPKLDQEASRIVRRIAAAVTNPNVSVEDELFNIAKSLISSFFNVFSKKLTKKDEEEIKKSFSGHYNLIKSSPHLDEFVFFLPEVQGDFFSHKNRISIPFIELINLSLTEGIRVGENGYINQPLQQQVAGSIKKVLATNSLQDNLTALKARTERKLDSNNLTPGSTFHYFLTTLTEDNYEKLTDFFCAQIKEPNDLVKQLSVDELSALFEHPLWEGMIARMCSSEDEQHSLYSTAIQRAYESVDRVNEKLVSPVGHEFNSQQINTQWDNAIRTIEDSARKYTSKLTYGLKSKERKDQVKRLEGLATQLSDKKEASPSEKIKTLIQVMSDLNHLSTEIDKEQPGKKSTLAQRIKGIREQLITHFNLKDSPLHQNADEPTKALLEFEKRCLGNELSNNYKCLHHLNTRWWSAAGLGVVRQLPSKCYTDEVVTLLNQSTPEQFVPSVVKAIQTDERLVELNFDELKQRGLFIQAIDAKGFAAEVRKSLLRLNKSWWGDLAALDKLIPLELKIASAELIIFLNEVGLDALDAEMLDGLAYHLKNKPATKLSLDDLRERGHYCHLLGGLGETHPILHQLNKEWWTEQPIAAIKAFDNSFYNKHLIDFLNKIGPKQFTDEVQTKLAEWDKQKAIHVSLAKKDRNNQPQGIEIANNNNKELGANQAVYSKVEAAKKRYDAHNKSRWYDLSWVTSNKNKLIQLCLSEALSGLDATEQSLDSAKEIIKTLKQTIEHKYQNGQESTWSWYYWNMIIPESGKLLNQLIEDIEQHLRCQNQQATTGANKL